MFTRKKPLIEFYTHTPGLSTVEEVKPQPAQKFIPSWWKQIPPSKPLDELQTVKICPSFPHYFSSGMVMPMWADTIIHYDETSEEWNWRMGLRSTDNPFSVTIHSDKQFIDYVSPSFQGDSGNKIFKFLSPWRIKTPKGYSVLQLPMFYHYEHDFSVFPGVVHTDIHHDINQQVLYHGKGKEIFIKRGTPLAQYIPFKRVDFGIDVREANLEDIDRDKKLAMSFMTKFLGSGAYKTTLKTKNKG
jgi:hypothetical protein